MGAGCINGYDDDCDWNHCINQCRRFSDVNDNNIAGKVNANSTGFIVPETTQAGYRVVLGTTLPQDVGE